MSVPAGPKFSGQELSLDFTSDIWQAERARPNKQIEIFDASSVSSI